VAKIVSVSSSKNRGEKNSNIFQKFWNWFSNLDKFTKLAFVTLLIISIVTPTIVTNRFDIRQRAAPTINKTATITISPSTGSFPIQVPFNVDIVVDGGGQIFNAAKINISVSSNLVIQNLVITPANGGGCNFVWANQNFTPTKADPSFAGAILNNYSQHCTVYTLTLLPTALGPASVSITNGSVKAYQDSSEILSNTVNGNYTIVPAVSITPSPIPSATPTTGPTVTPVPTNLPSPTPTSVPTITPTQTPPTPTPTSILPPPTIDNVPTATYLTSITISGTKTTATTTVFVNNSSTLVTYPSTTTWQATEPLNLGLNVFNVFGEDAASNKSTTHSVRISEHKLGDIDGDGIVDLTDLSMFATDYGNTGTLNYILSDMNGDGVVDLTDFSIIARVYGS